MSIQPSILPRLNRFLARRSAAQIAVICVLLQAMVAGLDFATGPDVIAMPFYGVPIAIGAWYVGLTLGAFNVALSTVITLGIQISSVGLDALAHRLQFPVSALVRIMAFFLVAIITARVSASVKLAAQLRRGRARPRTISSGEFEYTTIEELSEPRSSRRQRVPSSVIL